MNAKMLQDALDAEKRKTKILSIILTIAICAFVGMTIFAFCSFEVVREDVTEISYENNQDANTEGDNSSITLTNTTSETNDDNTVYVICGTVIVCIALIILGVYLYGKSKSTYKKDNQNTQKDSNTQA